MKTFIGPFRLFMAVSILALILSSCQKRLTDDVTTSEEVKAASYTSTHGCKPMVFGVVVKQPDGVSYWRTLMQKWYGSDGKVAYLKANIGTDRSNYEIFEVKLDWGEVTYHNNNQVYLRDVLRNMQLMRVTLMPDGKPAASYFTSEGDRFPDMIDTSYYYYNGDMLESIISISNIATASGSTFVFRKYSFFYDMHGNLIRAETGSGPGSYKMHIKYDYSKPVTDMMVPHFLNFPYQLLDYMDLFHFPVHHQITSVVFGEYQPGLPYPDETYPIARWMYTNYMLEPNGLVRSYMDVADVFEKTFYTGWQCSPMMSAPANREKTTIGSVADFEQLYPR